MEFKIVGVEKRDGSRVVTPGGPNQVCEICTCGVEQVGGVEPDQVSIGGSITIAVPPGAEGPKVGTVFEISVVE